MTDSYNETFDTRAVKITDYDLLNLTETNWLSVFKVTNYWSPNNTVNWNFSNPLVTSNTPVNLTQNESVIVLVESNYTDQGSKYSRFIAYNGSSVDTYIGNFLVKMLDILRNIVLSENQNSTIVAVDIRNNVGQQLVSWLFNTGQQNISSNQTIQLNNTEQAIIIIESNYTNTSVNPTSFTINTSSYNDTSPGITIT